MTGRRVSPGGDRRLPESRAFGGAGTRERRGGGVGGYQHGGFWGGRVLENAGGGGLVGPRGGFEGAGRGEPLERAAALAALGPRLRELGAQLRRVAAGGVERGAQLDRVGAR